jgi:hypothetical protein
MVSPASPWTVNRSQPTRFWPKSTSVLPSGDVNIPQGERTLAGPAGTDARSSGQRRGRQGTPARLTAVGDSVAWALARKRYETQSASS